MHTVEYKLIPALSVQPFTNQGNKQSQSKNMFSSKKDVTVGLKVEGNRQKIREKWEREQVKQWLCFVVRYALDHSCFDVQEELIVGSQGQQIYRLMSKYISTKSQLQSQYFSKSTILQNKKRKIGSLLAWVVSKLRRVQDQKVIDLMMEYSRKQSEKSPYMLFIGALEQDSKVANEAMIGK